MTTFSVFVKGLRGGCFDADLTVEGRTTREARGVAAEILGIPSDIVVLEVAA